MKENKRKQEKKEEEETERKLNAKKTTTKRKQKKDRTHKHIETQIKQRINNKYETHKENKSIREHSTKQIRHIMQTKKSLFFLFDNNNDYYHDYTQYLILWLLVLHVNQGIPIHIIPVAFVSFTTFSMMLTHMLSVVLHYHRLFGCMISQRADEDGLHTHDT